MLEIAPHTIAQLNLSVYDVANYVSQKGWQAISHPNKRLLVFTGPLDDAGEPIQLVLPSQNKFGDTPIRLAEAVSLLAIVEDRTAWDILADIQEQENNGHLLRNGFS